MRMLFKDRKRRRHLIWPNNNKKLGSIFQNSLLAPRRRERRCHESLQLLHSRDVVTCLVTGCHRSVIVIPISRCSTRRHHEHRHHRPLAFSSTHHGSVYELFSNATLATSPFPPCFYTSSRHRPHHCLQRLSLSSLYGVMVSVYSSWFFKSFNRSGARILLDCCGDGSSGYDRPR